MRIKGEERATEDSKLRLRSKFGTRAHNSIRRNVQPAAVTKNVGIVGNQEDRGDEGDP